MNRSDYLYILRKNLHQLPLDETDEIIRDMNEHFELGLEAGKTEEEISKQLGDPVFLASQYTRNYPKSERYTRQTEPTYNPLAKITGSIMIGFIWIMAIGPIIAVYATLFSFIVAGFAFIIAGFAFAIALVVTTILPISFFATLCGVVGSFILGVSIIRLSALGMSGFTRLMGKFSAMMRSVFGGGFYA